MSLLQPSGLATLTSSCLLSSLHSELSGRVVAVHNMYKAPNSNPQLKKEKEKSKKQKTPPELSTCYCLFLH